MSRKHLFRDLLTVLAVLLPAITASAQQDFDLLRIIPNTAGTLGVLEHCESEHWLTAPDSTLCHSIGAPADITSAVNWKLPAADGLSGEAMITDGAGNLSWAANSPGGCPAGSDTWLQYHDSGSCGASSSYAIAKSGNALLAFVTEGASPVNSISGSSYASSGTPYGFSVFGRASAGTEATPTATLAGHVFFDLSGRGHDGTSFTAQALMRIPAVATWTGASKPTRFDFYTTPIGSTTLTRRWIIDHDGVLLPAADSAYNLGLNIRRILAGYSDTWNTEILQITRASHASHITQKWDGTAYQIEDTSGADMVSFANATGAATFSDDILVNADSAQDIASDTIRVANGFSDTWNTEVLQITRASHASHFAMKWDGTLFQIENTVGTDIFTINNSTSGAIFAGTVRAPQLVVDEAGALWTINSETSGLIETLEFSDPGPNVRVQFGNFFSRYAIRVADDIACATAAGCNLGGPRTRFGTIWGSHLLAGASLSVSGRLELFDNTVAGRAVLRGGDISANVVFLFDDHLVPGAGSVTLGLSSNPYDLLWVDEIDLQTTHSAGAGEGASLIGITKDGVDTLEVDNLAISGDGNFYLRPGTGDPNCTGVDDGWFWVQTTDEELQVCIGGNLRIVALSAP